MSADPPSAPDVDPLDRDRARRNPEEAVDALERRVLGGPEHRLDGGYPDDLSPEQQDDAEGDTDGAPPTEAAFGMDVDPEDQGSSTVAPRNPD